MTAVLVKEKVCSFFHSGYTDFGVAVGVVSTPGSPLLHSLLTRCYKVGLTHFGTEPYCDRALPRISQSIAHKACHYPPPTRLVAGPSTSQSTPQRKWELSKPDCFRKTYLRR